MDSFVEAKTGEVSLHIENVEENNIQNTTTIKNKENLTNLQLPFQETYQKGFLYYYNDIDNNIQQLLERDTDNLGKENQFEDAISENQNFSPLGQNSGFLAFGGYNLGKLPQRGELGNISDDFSVENEVLYLNTTRKDKTVPSWIRMDLTEGTFYDIIYGDSLGDKKDPAFEITEEEINNETVTYIILNKTDWFINTNTEIFSEEKTGDGSTRSFVMNDSLVGKITSVRYQQQLSIPPNQYEYNINTKTITFTFVPQNNAPITIYYIKKERLLDFIEENNGQYINRLSDVSYSAAQDCLDIPEQINNLDIKELQLESGLEYTNQVIIPTQDLFVFGKDNFLTHDSYTELRMIRNKPEVRYNLQENIIIPLDSDDVSDNIFVLSKDSLKNGRFTNLDELYQSYPIIYYGIGCLSGSKFRYFNLRNTDKYPNDNLNFAIVNTPSLQGYIESFTETENNNSIVYSDSGEGVLISEDGSKIKSFSSKYIINKINADSGRDSNTIKISDLRAASNINGSVTVEPYALLSARDVIHTLIINEANSIDFSGDALNLGQDSKLEKVVVNDIDNFGDIEYNLSLTQQATLEWNLFGTKEFSSNIWNNSFYNLISKYPIYYNTVAILNSYKNIEITNSVYYKNEGAWNTNITEYDFLGNNFNSLVLSGTTDNLTTTWQWVNTFSSPVETNSLDLKNLYNISDSNELPTFKAIKVVSLSRQLQDITKSLMDTEELTIFLENQDNTEIENLSSYLQKIKKIDFKYFGKFTKATVFDSTKTYYHYTANNNRPIVYVSPNDNISDEDNISNLNFYTLENYNSINMEINNSISKDTFEYLPKLKEIYLPEDIISQNKIGARAFYQNSPIDIFVYIFKKPDSNGKEFLNSNIDIQKYRELYWPKHIQYEITVKTTVSPGGGITYSILSVRHNNKNIWYKTRDGGIEILINGKKYFDSSIPHRSTSGISVYQRTGSEVYEGDSLDEKVLIFPNDSRIYFYNLAAEDDKYRTKLVGTYNADRPKNRYTTTLQLYKYKEIEDWGNDSTRTDEEKTIYDDRIGGEN